MYICLCIYSSQGLAYLHDRNIIHRDVKSLNYLVSKDWVVKIAGNGVFEIYVIFNLDFGQARKLDANVTMTANRGTIHWMV